MGAECVYFLLIEERVLLCIVAGSGIFFSVSSGKGPPAGSCPLALDASILF